MKKRTYHYNRPLPNRPITHHIIGSWIVLHYPSGRTDKFRRLWVDGKYVPDPAITFTDEERGRIQASHAVIRNRLNR